MPVLPAASTLALSLASASRTFASSASRSSRATRSSSRFVRRRATLMLLMNRRMWAWMRMVA